MITDNLRGRLRDDDDTDIVGQSGDAFDSGFLTPVILGMDDDSIRLGWYHLGDAVNGTSYGPLGQFKQIEFVSTDYTQYASTPAIAERHDNHTTLYAFSQYDGTSDNDVVMVPQGHSALTISDSPTVDEIDPSIASFADGSCIVSYTTRALGQTDDTDIAVRMVSAGNLVTGEIAVDAPTGGTSDNANYSKVAALSNGDAVVVWAGRIQWQHNRYRHLLQHPRYIRRHAGGRSGRKLRQRRL